MAPEKTVTLSENAGWIARRIYTALSTYYAHQAQQMMTLVQAISRATQEAKHAAIGFDQTLEKQRAAEDVKWVARRAFSQLVVQYLMQGLPIEHAIGEAIERAHHIARAFEENFPTKPTIDVTPEKESQPGTNNTDAQPTRPPTGSKFQPGLENFVAQAQPTPPKETGT